MPLVGSHSTIDYSILFDHFELNKLADNILTPDISKASFILCT